MAKTDTPATHEAGFPFAAKQRPEAVTAAQQARREGKKSLAETHLEEQAEASGVKPEVEIKPAAPLDPRAMLKEQAANLALARARNLPSGNKPAPEKRKYNVVLNGEEHKNVLAVNALEAWSQCCDGAKSWPSPKTALVTEVTDDEGDESEEGDKPKRAKSEAATTSPYANDLVPDAVDKIGRARSRKHLEAARDHDTRKGVQDAAEARLQELGDEAE